MVNYVLRIANDKWLKRNFREKSYYPGVGGRWQRGTKVLLLMMVKRKDSVVGYGVVGRVKPLSQLTEDEQKLCKSNWWTRKIEFRRLVRLKPPIPVKETALAPRREAGVYWQAARITDAEFDSVVTQTRARSSL